jgi:methylglutaconyl-CoA hydratase
MSAPQTIVLTAVDDRGVATITLNRPQKGNAYDRGMLARLMAIVTDWSAAPNIRAIVIRGSGKHFCVGGDLDDPFVHTVAEAGTPQVLMPHLCLAIDACQKPTIVLVHGACFGGGFALASVCDVWLASEDSFYALPELRLGFGVGPYIPFFARAMGARQLRRYLLTAERFTAHEALAMGVAHKLYPPGEGDAALEVILGELLQSAPEATAATKRELSAIADLTPSRARIDELQADFHALYHAAEGAEGRAAFREKRRPAWTPKT